MLRITTIWRKILSTFYRQQELAHHRVKLQKAMSTSIDPHVDKTYLLQPRKLDMLWTVKVLRDPCKGGYDVSGAVALLEDFMDWQERCIPILCQTSFQAYLDPFWLRLVVHSEDMLMGDSSESIVSRLGAVQDISHIA